MESKVAFITGASSGIGAAAAREFARRKYHVVLFARRADRLRDLKNKIEADGGHALAITGDVTRPESLEAAVKATLAEFGRIDVTLCNAGFGVGGPFTRLTVEDYRRQFETNVFGVLNTLYATREAVTQQKGILAIVGSVAGQIAMPFSTSYCMSKFAVRALSHGLRDELARKGVAVVLIAPGFIETEIHLVDNYGKLQEKATKQFPKQLVVPIEKAAPKIVSGILSRRREVIITGHGKLLVFLNQYFPWLVRFLSGRMVK